MAKQRIYIENLRIRLPRGMTGSARKIAGGFGREIVNQIADIPCGKNGAFHIDEISAIRLKASAGETDLRKCVAEKVSAELKKRIGQEG